LRVGVSSPETQPGFNQRGLAQVLDASSGSFARQVQSQNHPDFIALLLCR